ncbi:MAG: osmotically inducible protein OsmC [bacterium (Candidatus Ratteibacteria) CG_4_9_14_3_um_filter_41_21]|uniref:Osmotically inducible protein OsmC n=3 Tax=Candidatus Ratteibacteria TaxID=2979319 RepID=A0A2M7E825_9BACT|nr:MAG: hypothetical protein AUJ76_03400 [Candidatus Omnitrophica bacterium CG1_02_41_171]PIV63863.1 MAG: osmotically inducible protein OsmC [bacterium (Candidatus Ratteibacteria) CG01_land_8_20_14_3_00_40_19]PIW33717.1 MAG: osmotically inducible protein OsmC [bacterium (Candidatus Ratteibacteria) CG15_BIG_FIL_POST_REV_8_21_14_020_41_12]PIW73946.1 MAG: osmotically inducible protein OsmC [bacterium (Candidatus Ratteibacteria) CG_4_8_14_3_um_filter_41_36]PJA62241.1 MAG: osmotically inducible prot
MDETRAKPKKFIYRTNLKWVEARKGLLSSSGKPTIKVSTPPEFKGHPGIWTPEDLFVASVNACIMTTFLYYAERENLKFLSYESSAEGILEKSERGLIFSSIEVVPKISVTLADDIEKTKNLLALSEKNCLISNSIKSKITVRPEIKAVKR